MEAHDQPQLINVYYVEGLKGQFDKHKSTMS